MLQSAKAASNSDCRPTTQPTTISHYDGHVIYKIARWRRRIGTLSRYPLKQRIISPQLNLPQFRAPSQLPRYGRTTTMTTSNYNAEYSTDPSPPRPPTAGPPQALEPRVTAATSSALEKSPTRPSEEPAHRIICNAGGASFVLKQ